MKKTYYAIIFLFVIFLSGCNNMPPKEVQVSTPPQPVLEKTIVISAVGDIMMHSTQIKAGYHATQNSYDFSPFFTKISPFLKMSDFVIGNLETTLGKNPSQYGGYPRFNSPAALAHNLKEAGFDLLTTANNHCMDKGIQGLFDTLQYLDEAKLLHTGTSRNQEEQNTILTTDIQGVKTAFLSYTYGTNGLNPPSDFDYAVNYINEQQIALDIKKARNEGAKLVFLCLHFGQEYHDKPSNEQTKLSQFLLEEGADIILGYHPHVLQPATIYYKQEEVLQNTTKNIETEKKKKFIIYSLGNLISDQIGYKRKSSIILNLHFGINSESENPYFKEATYIPIWTHRYINNGKTNFEVVPIEPVLDVIKTGTKTNFTAKEIENLEQSWERTISCFEEANPDMTLQDIPDKM